MSIEGKLDDIKDSQTAIRIDIASIKVDLAHHIKRSDKHEKQIDRLWLVLIAIFAGGGAKFGPEILKLLIGG